MVLFTNRYYGRVFIENNLFSKSRVDFIDFFLVV